MYSKMVAGIILFGLLSCLNGQSPGQQGFSPANTVKVSRIFTYINNIPLPEGFERISVKETGFGKWLRNLALKTDKTVYLYNGSPKANQSAQFAVLDISVGNKDLQQCADAVMRLRAEYLFANKEYDRIRFTDNEGGIYQFGAPYSKEHLQTYLQRVFGMCGTASLNKQLKAVKMMDMQAGDVLIKGGFPGHAVIVVDMARNASGEKIYLLAQSYMPAQDIHILNNPNNESLSPWYLLKEEDVNTPEYYFTRDQLKSW
jgi:maltoporin